MILNTDFNKCIPIHFIMMIDKPLEPEAFVFMSTIFMILIS